MPEAPRLSALYYPHTTIADEGLLRVALLMWDRVSFIVPWKGFIAGRESRSTVRAAIEVVGEEVVVEQSAKDAVYKELQALVAKPIPKWLTLRAAPLAELEILKHEFDLYPEKIDGRIADLLKEHKLAWFKGKDENLYTNAATGLLVMALLARECAGTTKHTVTDRASAYAWLAKFAFTSETPEGKIAAQADAHVAKLYLLSLGALDLTSLPLPRLVEMRQREQATDGAYYRKFRHNYLKRLQEYAKRLTAAKNPADIRTIEREYQEEMRGDVTFLRDALKDNTFNAVVSKEIGIGLAASGGSFLLSGPSIQTVVTAGLGVMNVLQKFLSGRKKALSEHPMAWMYLASKGGVGRQRLS
jgi:hypothetical protein